VNHVQTPFSDLDGLPDGAADWLGRCLLCAGAIAERVRDTPRSTVVRLTTADDELFFKADHILPPPEASILVRLALSRPSRVPPIVAVDEVRGWSLTRDVGPTDPTCLDDEPTSAWCAVVGQFADVQRNTGLDDKEWVALGCRDFRGGRLFEAFEAMIHHAAPELEPADRVALLTLLPRIREACDDLAMDGIPSTLVHQDLVPENLVWNGTEAVFLDWSDTVVGHPFFGLDRLLDSCWSDPERKSAVIEAYLAEFADVAPLERLQASSKRVMWLRVLYEDLRWQHELEALDPECEHAVRMRADQLQGLTMVARHQS
jgi:hypothetical protein